MGVFDKSASYAADTKQIASYVATLLKPLGFSKRRNSFNRKLENGLIQQISLFTVGAYSIDHGKFYVHAGCYVPEVKLYSKQDSPPNWVRDVDCTIRGNFPGSYLEILEVVQNLKSVRQYIYAAIEALNVYDSYDSILGNGSKDGEFFLKMPYAKRSEGPLFFETPQPIVKTCILLARSDNAGASRILSWYLTCLRNDENAHLSHIKYVSEWAKKTGIHIS